MIEQRKMLPNASYFAFTATPKNKTLEMFGVPYPEGGEVKHRPFHSYTMKQAIEEGFKERAKFAEDSDFRDMRKLPEFQELMKLETRAL